MTQLEFEDEQLPGRYKENRFNTGSFSLQNYLLRKGIFKSIQQIRLFFVIVVILNISISVYFVYDSFGGSTLSSEEEKKPTLDDLFKQQQIEINIQNE